MILELLGNSGSGKTTILKRFITNEEKGCFWGDEWWYSKRKLKYLILLPYLLNFALIRLLIISRRVLKKNGIRGRSGFQQMRHLAFHFVIAKKAKRMSKKGYFVVLSESFVTLIPNMFLNRCDEQQKRFIKIVGDLFHRDAYLFIHNDIDRIVEHKSRRDGEADPIVTREKIEKQMRNLNTFIDSIGIEESIVHADYNYNDESLKKLLSILESMVCGHICSAKA